MVIVQDAVYKYLTEATTRGREGEGRKRQEGRRGEERGLGRIYEKCGV